MELITRYIQHVDWCCEKSEMYESKLCAPLLSMEGMTGMKTRHFYNNICSLPGTRYLEIGTHAGSSICSAIYHNNNSIKLAMCVDNWSEFGGPKETFAKNLDTYKGETPVMFLESDCWAIDTQSLPKFNIYMYDAGHTVEDHEKALTHFVNCMDTIFIYIVDDWNWDQVRNGTYFGIEKAGLHIAYVRHFSSPCNGHADWWNGMAVFILQKPSQV